MKKGTETSKGLEEDVLAFEEWEDEGGDAPAAVEERALRATPEPDLARSATEEEGFDPTTLAPDIPVQIVAVLAKKVISLKELMDFRMGQVVDLNRPPAETVDLVANGRLVARGELVDIDGKLGVRIVRLVR